MKSWERVKMMKERNRYLEVLITWCWSGPDKFQRFFIWFSCHIYVFSSFKRKYCEFWWECSYSMSVRFELTNPNFIFPLLQKTDAFVQLSQASLQFSSRDNSSGSLVNNVEQCACPDGYTVSPFFKFHTKGFDCRHRRLISGTSHWKPWLVNFCALTLDVLTVDRISWCLELHSRCFDCRHHRTIPGASP